MPGGLKLSMLILNTRQQEGKTHRTKKEKQRRLQSHSRQELKLGSHLSVSSRSLLWARPSLPKQEAEAGSQSDSVQCQGRMNPSAL